MIPPSIRKRLTVTTCGSNWQFTYSRMLGSAQPYSNLRPTQNHPPTPLGRNKIKNHPNRLRYDVLLSFLSCVALLSLCLSPSLTLPCVSISLSLCSEQGKRVLLPPTQGEERLKGKREGRKGAIFGCNLQLVSCTRSTGGWLWRQVGGLWGGSCWYYGGLSSGFDRVSN